MARRGISTVRQVPPISQYGNAIEITRRFDGPEQMTKAVEQMQALLYTA